MDTAKKLADYDKLELKMANLKILLANEINKNHKKIMKLDKEKQKEQLLILRTRSLFCKEVLKIIE